MVFVLRKKGGGLEAGGLDEKMAFEKKSSFFLEPRPPLYIIMVVFIYIFFVTSVTLFFIFLRVKRLFYYIYYN